MEQDFGGVSGGEGDGDGEDGEDGEDEHVNHDEVITGGQLAGAPASAPAPIPAQLGENSVFWTRKHEGGLRDFITVECLKINGETFNGTITYTEAAVKIFQQELGLTSDLLHSVKMAYSRCRTVTFKLKKQVNIDELAEKENFEMKRSYMQDTKIVTDIITCRIIGIKKMK